MDFGNAVPAGPGMGQASIGKAMKQMDTGAAKAAESIKKMDPITKAMNQSFQGMQGKASVIQKIVGMGLDAIGVGVSQVKKELSGALKKGIMEGDIPGMLQGFIDMSPFSKFADLAKFAKPWITAFTPINAVLSAVAGFAAQAVATNPEFLAFIEDIPNHMGELMELGQQFGDLVMWVMSMDWNEMMDVIKSIVNLVQTFANMFDFFRTAGQNWQNFWANAWSSGDNSGSGGHGGDSPRDDAIGAFRSSGSGGTKSVNFQTAVMSESQFRRLVNNVRTRQAMG